MTENLKENLYKDLDDCIDLIVDHICSIRIEMFKEDPTDIRNETDDIIDTSKFLYEAGYEDNLNCNIWYIINEKFKQKLNKGENNV